MRVVVYQFKTKNLSELEYDQAREVIKNEIIAIDPLVVNWFCLSKKGLLSEFNSIKKELSLDEDY